MSLPVYDSCRPSSKYFAFNERQPDTSIQAINNTISDRNDRNDRNDGNPQGNNQFYQLNQNSLNIPQNQNSYNNINNINNILSQKQQNSQITPNNQNFNSNYSDSSVRTYVPPNDASAAGPEENSFGVFLTKNYR